MVTCDWYIVTQVKLPCSCLPTQPEGGCGISLSIIIILWYMRVLSANTIHKNVRGNNVNGWHVVW